MAAGRGVLPAILPTNPSSSMSSVLHPRQQWAKPTKGGTHRTSTPQGKKRSPERSGDVRSPTAREHSRRCAYRAAHTAALLSARATSLELQGPLHPPAHPPAALPRQVTRPSLLSPMSGGRCPQSVCCTISPLCALVSQAQPHLLQEAFPDHPTPRLPGGIGYHMPFVT